MPVTPLLIANVHVLTQDPARPHARSVLLADGRIAALDAVERDGAVAIDGSGGTLLPGFIDPHVHLLAAAGAARAVDCSPAAVSSISEIQQVLAEAARSRPDGWLRGAGYDEHALTEGRHPTRWDLDAAVPDRPVRLRHRSGHALVLNSVALALAGIDTATEEPPGGVIDRRLDDGEPSGLLIDMDAVVDRVTPPLPFDELVAGMREVGAACLRAGITSVQDLTHQNDAERLDLLDRICAAAEFAPHRLPPATAPGVSGDGPVKIMPREAAGMDHAAVASLHATVLAAHLAGRQVAVHAATARTLSHTLNAIEAALRQAPHPDHRHRIEHAAVCPPELAARAAALGVVIVSNPAFLWSSGDRYLATVPPEEQPHLYALGALARAGVRVAAASDMPVVPPAPLRSIHGAIQRRSASGATLPGVPADAAAALAAVTSAAAFAARAEDRAGRIAPGLPAYLVLLSAVPTDPDARVWWTLIDGRVVWRADEAPRLPSGLA